MIDRIGRLRAAFALGFVGLLAGAGSLFFVLEQRARRAAYSAERYVPGTDPLVNPPSLFEPAPADKSRIDYGAVLLRTLDGNPATLNPLFQSSMYESRVLELLFETLFTFNAELDWQVNQNVTESFEESPDRLTYTVRLRPGLVWHDGHPITSHDVTFSLEQILDARVPCPSLKDGRDRVKECNALDDLTVVFRFDEALATNRWHAYFPIIPKHLHARDKEANPDLKLGDYYNKLNRAPIGNGPYKFVRWVDNDKIEVERWDGYQGPKPNVARQVFRIIPESNIQLLSFSKKETHETILTSKQFATQTGIDSDFAKVGYKVMKPQWDLVYICWNADGSNPFFGDVRVRRAMTQACDIPRIIRDLGYDLVMPSRGIFHPDSWMFNPEIELLPFDLRRAETLLDEAGWRVDPEDPEGWRSKVIDGKRVKFEFTLSLAQGSPIAQDLAAIFADDLKSIGVDMKTRTLEWATFSERNRKHEFQAMTAGWGTGSDPDTSWNIWHSSSYVADGSSGRNYGKYSNPRVDALYELARKEFDRVKRGKIYGEIAKLIYDEQPYTFLWHRYILWGINKQIHGVTSSPRGVFGFKPSVLGWWVETKN